MPRILVVYGTNTGHTARIARVIGDTLRARKFEVNVVQNGGKHRAVEYDGVVVAASIRGGKYQRAVGKWVAANSAAMRSRATAFVSVCLAVRDPRPETQQQLQIILDRFYAETGWRPTMTKVVAGALLYTQYNWLTRLVMKQIVKKAGGDIDTSRDYEYTDWDDVRGFAELFGDRVSGFAENGRSQVA